jgi:hypothetical protein
MVNWHRFVSGRKWFLDSLFGYIQYNLDRFLDRDANIPRL